MDFFYVWLRRTLHGLSPEIDEAFREPLGPKWNTEKKDGELIDDASRFGGDKAASKAAYEDGMFRAFQACDHALVPDGRMVVVFANKSPDAWETLVSAIIRAGFVVDGSWPIQTEMGNRHPSAVISGARLFRLARVPQAARSRAPRMGQSRPRRDAREHLHPASRILGCRHPRTRLRLGGDRPGDGGLQQASGRQEGQRTKRDDGGIGVPARRPSYRGRFRSRPSAHS